MEIGFYDVQSKKLFEKRVCQAKSNGFVWATDFPNSEPTYEEAKSWYHGNSKLLLHLFYNTILNRKEMQVTTKSVIKTFPQYEKKIEIL